MTLADSDGIVYELLGIEDLVLAKKTQRDKDWPMIRRLVDAHYSRNKHEPNDDRVRFWLRESRTPEVLIAVASAYPKLRDALMSAERPLLVETMSASKTALRQLLFQEEAEEKERDEAYWQPLKRELESLRQRRRESN